MINNSFFISIYRGGLKGLWARKAGTLIYLRLLAEWGGGFLYEVPYISVFLTSS